MSFKILKLDDQGNYEIVDFETKEKFLYYVDDNYSSSNVTSLRLNNYSIRFRKTTVKDSVTSQKLEKLLNGFKAKYIKECILLSVNDTPLDEIKISEIEKKLG